MSSSGSYAAGADRNIFLANPEPADLGHYSIGRVLMVTRKEMRLVICNVSAYQPMMPPGFDSG